MGKSRYEQVFDEDMRDNYSRVFGEAINCGFPRLKENNRRAFDRLEEGVAYVASNCIYINTVMTLNEILPFLQQTQVNMKGMSANEFYDWMQSKLKPVVVLAEVMYKNAQENHTAMQAIIDEYCDEAKSIDL